MFSPGDEASLLLEKALSSFDGIILGMFKESYFRKKSSHIEINSRVNSKSFIYCNNYR